MNNMTEKLITIHYNEIALKGNNRNEFIAQLVRNIKTALKNEKYKSIEKKESRVLILLDEESDETHILEKLKTVFGIDWFALAITCNADMEQIKEIVSKGAEKYAGKTVKVDAKRSDKSFTLKSMEINKEVGAVLHHSGFRIDVNNPQVMVRIEIMKEQANIIFERIEGLGGLPVGSAGKVLCLLSGGIDSPVAAWLMAKRGCTVDFLHVHPFSNNEQVKESKIPKIVHRLEGYFQNKSKLFILSHDAFYKKTFGINTRSELVLFRRFILKVANTLAKKHGYLGVVTGDNLAQVASQTLENMLATNEASELPVYRPVLTYDKDEIINLARKIGSYELSIEEYKDCCSLVARKDPSTKTKIEEVKRLESEIDIEKVVGEAMNEVEES